MGRVVVGQLLLEGLEHREAVGELGQPGLRVDGEEVQPVVACRCRVQRGLDGGVAGAVDRPGGQAQVQVGVVRRLGVLGLRDRDVRGPGVPGVQHRGVELEVHLGVQPVVDHPGDLRQVLRALALGLDQAGDDDRVTLGDLVVGRHRGELDALRLLVEPQHPGPQHLDRLGAGLDGVGGREQIALRVALGVGGQAQGRDVLDRLLVALQVPGDLPEGRGDLGQPLPFRDHRLEPDPGGGLQQQRERQRGGHVLVQPVVARLEGAAVAAGLRRVGKGPHAGDHALVHQLLADHGGGFAGLDMDRDVAGARAGVVRRVQVVVPDVEEAAAGDADHDRQDGKRDPRRGPAHGALALRRPAARPAGRRLAAAAFAGRAVPRGPAPAGTPEVRVLAEPGQDAVAVLVIPPGLVLVHVAVPAPAVTIPMIIGVFTKRLAVPVALWLWLVTVVIGGLIAGVAAGIAVVRPGRVIAARIAGAAGIALLRRVVLLPGVAGPGAVIVVVAGPGGVVAAERIVGGRVAAAAAAASGAARREAVAVTGLVVAAARAAVRRVLTAVVARAAVPGTGAQVAGVVLAGVPARMAGGRVTAAVRGPGLSRHRGQRPGDRGRPGLGGQPRHRPGIHLRQGPGRVGAVIALAALRRDGLVPAGQFPRRRGVLPRRSGGLARPVMLPGTPGRVPVYFVWVVPATAGHPPAPGPGAPS